MDLIADEAIRQVISDALAGALKDPRVGFVTVTDVRTSADLSHARVYVSVLGEHGEPSTPERREASLEGLRSAHGFVDDVGFYGSPLLDLFLFTLGQLRTYDFFIRMQIGVRLGCQQLLH